MKKVRTNENQSKIDKIANDMAVLFEEKITPSDLTLWLAIVNGSNKRGAATEEFTWTFGYCFLPGFIKCDTKNKRIDFLKEGIVDAFAFLSLKECLSEIGCQFCSEFKEGRESPESINEFMKPFVTFLILSEMYSELKLIEEREDEQKKAA